MGIRAVRPPDSVIVSAPAGDLMAGDEAMMARTAADGKMRGRVYRFRHPAVTAGRHAAVEAEEIERWAGCGHDFARRPTGGGVLRHEHDLSFGVAFPRCEEFAGAFLLRVSEAMAQALREQGIETSRPVKPAAIPQRCFEAAVGNELIYRGGKILGLAARVVRGAVLVQGSLAVRRNAARDQEVIGAGATVDLAGSGLDEECFARRFLALCGCSFPWT